MRTLQAFAIVVVCVASGFVAGNRWGHRAADKWWEEHTPIIQETSFKAVIRNFELKGNYELKLLDHALISNVNFMQDDKAIGCEITQKPEIHDDTDRVIHRQPVQTH